MRMQSRQEATKSRGWHLRVRGSESSRRARKNDGSKRRVRNPARNPVRNPVRNLVRHLVRHPAKSPVRKQRRQEAPKLRRSEEWQLPVRGNEESERVNPNDLKCPRK